MDDKDCLIFLAMDSEGSPIGQARFEINGDEALISISVRKEFRDRGYGSRIIEFASKKIFEVSDIHKIDSYIRIENKLSKSAFMNAGYKEIGLTTIKGHLALHLTLTK
jgi:RimJ/RimL family protein N-acetyltransferase